MSMATCREKRQARISTQHTKTNSEFSSLPSTYLRTFLEFSSPSTSTSPQSNHDGRCEPKRNASSASRNPTAAYFRAMRRPLFHAQRDERIDARGAACGKVASQQRHQDAHGRAYERQEHALLEHERQHLARLSAQRHAQADFTGSLRHGIRQHAVNSNRREDERERAEQAEQRRAHARGPQPLPQNLLHGLGVGEGQIFVNRLDLSADGPEKRFWIAVSTHDERGPRGVSLPHGDIRNRLGIFANLADNRGAHNADNLEQSWFRHNREALSKRFLAGPHHLGHGLVDNDHWRGVFAVEVREVAAAQKRDAHGREVAGRHVVKINEGATIIGIGLFAFAKNSACESASEDAVRGHRGAYDAGNRFRALDDVTEKLLTAIGVITKSAEVEQ